MIKLIGLLVLVSSIQGYYISHNVKDAEEHDPLDNFDILIPDNQRNEEFPQEFLLDFFHEDSSVQVKFTRNEEFSRPEIYVMDDNGNPVKYRLKDAEVYLIQFYF